MNSANPTAGIFFRWVVNHPKTVIAITLAFMVLMATFAPQLTKDTRADAFLADDNPALIYRDKVKALFGLSDPFVVAIVAEDTVFTPAGLNTVSQLSEAIASVENIDPDRVTSLATENNIVGSSDGMDVSPFYSETIDNQSQADRVRDAIRNFPLYQGSLVSNDETATLIVAELLDEQQAEATYINLQSALSDISLPAGHVLHVAGEGAISGYLGSYIDADAQRLNPIAALIITLVLFIAFLRFGSTIAANIIIAASAAVTLGAMAAFGVPFFVITNALPVILIGIAVADSIHVYSEYFTRRALHPDESINDSIVASLQEMWRPITLTTLTTMAGFLGLYFAAYMPPFKYFGLFAAVGVAAAWLYSLTFLPAFMSLLKTEVHPRLARKIIQQKYDGFARFMVMLGRFTRHYSRLVIVLAAAVAVVGALAASQLIVNEERIATFHPSEPLYIADQQINQRFDGTNYLDIVIETGDVEAVFEPTVLQAMEALQDYAVSLPGVMKATSIVDYLKQMNRALNGGDSNQYVLPLDKDLVAQYFLLYSSSSDPADFQEEVDYDYRLANIRLTLNTGEYQKTKTVIETLNQYINNQFNDDTKTANLSGRVNLNYHWIDNLGVSHFAGMGIALLLVWLMSSLLFRSLIAGAYSLIPVATSILIVYSAMAVLKIPLGIGTSMFAAVAIGLGVDFAIHTIDRLRALYQQYGDMGRVLDEFYPSTGRALLFNLLAIALGFGVLLSSKVVPLNNFGTIVALSVLTSFIISLTLLPAMVLQFRPRFVTGLAEQAKASAQPTTMRTASVLLALLTTVLSLSVYNDAHSADIPEGRWVMEQVNAVDDGDHVTRNMAMRMTDKRGKVREREVVSYRKYFGDEKRTILFYLSPRNVRDTGFLTFDYASADVDDDQWLYLPALRKARRISASDRGDYFLGTDFTYEDIKNEGKVELDDYRFTNLGKTTLDGVEVWHIESVPATDKIAKELGYGKVHSWIDPVSWQAVKAEYWDVKLNPLKTLVISDIRQIDGIWTRHQLRVNNHKTGHQTDLVFSDVDYKAEVKDQLFSRQALSRGVAK